jgi:lauroyl-KDO2-lipid IV(A) myristoyltransferase
LSEAERAARARAHFHAWARSMADVPALWWDFRCRVPARRCDVHGFEHVRAPRAAGRTVILLGAHSTAIEFGGVAVASHLPQAVMVNRMSDPVIDWLVRRVRDRYDGIVLERDAGLRPVLRAARIEGALYYAPDEDLGARDSVFVPFFGRPKATLATLGRLTQALDAAVVPMYAWYDTAARRYQVHLRPELTDFPSGDTESDARAMNEALEQLIELCPAQYLWSYRLFRTQPDGTRLRYPKRSSWRRYLRRRKRL